MSLRYPLGRLNETSDYLRINITEYIKSTTVNDFTYGEPKTTGGVFNFIDASGNRKYLANNSTNRKIAAEQQALTGDTTVSGGGISFSRRKNKDKSDYGTIFLPIPSNIQDGNSVKYTEGSLDGLTANLLAVVLGPMRSVDDISTAITNLLKGGKNAMLDPASQEYFIRNLSAEASNMPFGGNLTGSQLLARETGNILNPNMELLFEGVTLRSFKFSFKLTPRGPNEAKQVKKIIRTLKQNMAPGSSQKGFNNVESSIPNLYLTTPKIFELTYMKGGDPHPFLHRFKPCFLTEMTVNYTGDGVYATYGGPNDDGGGTPVSMIMDLGFKELEPIYAGDYTDDIEGVGY